MGRQSAVQSHNVTLVDLKLVDLLQTSDILVFTHKSFVFEARVSKTACIVNTTVRGESIEGEFANPSSWTKACIQWYMNHHKTSINTIASSYTLIYVKRTHQNLQQLRDEYISTFMCSVARQPRRPDAIVSNMPVKNIAKNGSTAYLLQRIRTLQQEKDEMEAAFTNVVQKLLHLRSGNLDPATRQLVERLDRAVHNKYVPPTFVQPELHVDSSESYSDAHDVIRAALNQ